MDPQSTNLPQQDSSPTLTNISNQPLATVSTSPNSDRQKSYMGMWDTFEHILMFITLYIVALSIGLFLHYYVDKFLPPVLIGDSYSLTSWGSGTLLPMLMSSLFVAYPIFAFLFINTKKRSLANPKLLNLKSRKVLIYFTLVITFMYMVFKIINLVYSAFTGNFSFNFLLHFLVTVGINGFIFIYYALEVRKEINA